MSQKHRKKLLRIISNCGWWWSIGVSVIIYTLLYVKEPLNRLEEMLKYWQKVKVDRNLGYEQIVKFSPFLLQFYFIQSAAYLTKNMVK
jgi:hypothetical protein